LIAGSYDPGPLLRDRVEQLADDERNRICTPRRAEGCVVGRRRWRGGLAWGAALGGGGAPPRGVAWGGAPPRWLGAAGAGRRLPLVPAPSVPAYVRAVVHSYVRTLVRAFVRTSLDILAGQNYQELMTRTDRPADLLRAALKAAGFNARRVTVREDGCTLRVTIRDAAAPRSTVAAIADRFRQVRYDHATGEILCGGNTFVDVRYLDALVAPVADVVAALLAGAADGEIVALAGGFRAAKMSRAQGATYADEVRIWRPGFDETSNIAVGVRHAAQRIAVAYLDARASAAEAAGVEVRS